MLRLLFFLSHTFAMKIDMTAVASSGAELPAAINVAPATSDCICNTEIYRRLHGRLKCVKCSEESTENLYKAW